MGKIDKSAMTVNGRSLARKLRASPDERRDVIRPHRAPMKAQAGFLNLTGNLFDSAIMKTSVISESSARATCRIRTTRTRSRAAPSCSTAPRTITRASTIRRSRSTRARMLVIRGAGPIGYPGAAEVVNMPPPDYLIAGASTSCRASATGASRARRSPSILNASPEAATGGASRCCGPATAFASTRQAHGRHAGLATRSSPSGARRSRRRAATNPGEPDAVAGDPARAGRRAVRRHGVEAGGQVPAHRRKGPPRDNH